MSFQAMTWAVDQELPTNEKMVLIMLANRTNHDTGRCDPSHKRLATDCGMSISTLKRCLKSLEKTGLLEVITRKAGEVNLPNQYLLKLNGVGSHRTDPSSHRTEGGSHRTDPSSHRTEGVGSHWPTKQEDLNQEINQEYKQEVKQKEKAQAPACIDAGINSVCKAVFSHWQNVHGKAKAKMTTQRLQKIKARLNEGYKIDQLFRAIEGVKLSPYHMGKNDSCTVYDDLTTILRDGSQVEKFSALADNPHAKAIATGQYSAQTARNIQAAQAFLESDNDAPI